MTTMDDLMSLIREVKKDVEKGNKELKEDNYNLRKQVKNEIASLANEVEKVRLKTEEKDDDNRKRTDMMNKRMRSIENEMKKNKDQTENRIRSQKTQEKRVEDFMRQMGMKTNADNELINADMDIDKETSEKNNDTEKNKNTEKTKSSWAKIIENEMTEDAKKLDNTKKNDKNDKNETKDKDTNEKNNAEKPEKPEKPTKPLKMGNSLEQAGLHSETDWGWNESEEEWDGTVEREKEKERKTLLRREKMTKIQTETATKASKIVGAHPITQESIDKFNMITGDYEEAKREAAKEYLINILGFELDELETFSITDTQVSKNADDVLYIAINDKEIIGEIRRRVAERQNPEIYVRDYVPPQFFERFRALNNLCKDLRTDRNIKTQIRFSESDLVIMTKIRGSNEPYRVRKLSAEEKKQIPVFDHSLVWRKKTEKPPRKKLAPIVGKVTVPSMENIQRDTTQKTVKNAQKNVTSTPSKRQKMDTDGADLTSSDESM